MLNNHCLHSFHFYGYLTKLKVTCSISFHLGLQTHLSPLMHIWQNCQNNILRKINKIRHFFCLNFLNCSNHIPLPIECTQCFLAWQLKIFMIQILSFLDWLMLWTQFLILQTFIEYLSCIPSLLATGQGTMIYISITVYILAISRCKGHGEGFERLTLVENTPM